MKIEHLFVLRHAPYTGRGFLTPEGHARMEDLGKSLRNRYKFSSCDSFVLCSTEPRTFRSAQAMLPGFENDWVEELYSDDKQCDVKVALKRVLSECRSIRNLFVISHLEMVAALPSAFGSKVLGINSIPREEVEYGQGFHIDVKKKAWDRIIC